MGDKIAVLGGGSWGATLAHHLANRGHQVSVWEYNPEVAKKLQEERCLATLPQLKLNPAIQVGNDFEQMVKDKEILVNATPSHTVQSTFGRKGLKRGAMVINASKGFEPKTGQTLSTAIRDIFKNVGDIVILSGPSHAEEVAQGQVVALVAASTSRSAAKRVQDLASTDRFRIYTNEDPIGVELGGALKNIYALACGVVDGLQLGDNTKAALITRGLAEMTRFGVKMKATPLTFFGLAGLGDLIVTCNSKHSRNRKLGEMIGKGLTLSQSLSQMTMVAEGVNTTKMAHTLAKKFEVDTPIINEMQKVLFENKSPKDSVKDLMARQVGSEMEGLVL